jgi:hypothetical protein
LDYLGSGWVCEKGFYKSGKECLEIIMPENGILDYSGNGWICNEGFKKVGSKCITMTATEIKKQKATEASIKAQIARSVARGKCDTEYKTNSEVCIKITDTNLDCHQNYYDNYYTGCDVSLSYRVETDYKGGSYLNTNIECEVEIEYKGRNAYSTSNDSDSSRKSHYLYAHNSERKTMDFSFSFGSYDEVTNAKISEARCMIKDIYLY